MRKCVLVVLAGLVLGLFSIGAYAQHEAGDKEIGASGSLVAGHGDYGKYIGSNLTATGEFGYYLSDNQYVGAAVGPTISFNDGDTSGTFMFAGDYRYLLGTSNPMVWPFAGAMGGVYKIFDGDSAGLIAPQVGVKFYVSQSSAFEASYSFPILFMSGSRTTMSIFQFGFKHLLGK